MEPRCQQEHSVWAGDRHLALLLINDVSSVEVKGIWVWRLQSLIFPKAPSTC
jgi:hypothetical protein